MCGRTARRRWCRIRRCSQIPATIGSAAPSCLSREFSLWKRRLVADSCRFVKATITLPQEYLGRVIELCEANRGEQKSLEFFHGDQVILVYDIPAAQLVEDLFGKLKGATSVDPFFALILMLTSSQQGVRYARLRGRRLAAEQARQAPAPRQQAARRCHLSRGALVAGRSHRAALGDQVQRARRPANVWCVLLPLCGTHLRQRSGS